MDWGAAGESKNRIKVFSLWMPEEGATRWELGA